MRLNKSTRLPAGTGSWATGTWGIGTWAIGFAMVVVAAAAMLFAARQPSTTAGVTVKADRQTAAVAMESSARKMPNARVAVKTTGAKGTAGEAGAKAAAQQPEIATITGCLEERKDQTFRLKNTVGEDAPKSRSWKAGFLKKSSAAIDLVDPSNRGKLSSHVGERVSITGMLDDREMQVRSLQRVAESCE
jgi:hypothetical protein